MERGQLFATAAVQGFVAAKVTPRVSNSAASDSCLEPEKTSTSLPQRTSLKPTWSRTQRHSAYSRAPAIQPDQRSMSSFAS